MRKRHRPSPVRCPAHLPGVVGRHRGVRARNALYLPTSREAKYKAKQANDTFIVRFGDLLSAGLVFAGVTWLGFTTKHFALTNAAFVVIRLVRTGSPSTRS